MQVGAIIAARHDRTAAADIGRIRSALAQASLLGADLHHQEQQDLER
jgi:hypothetical protein